MVEQVKQWSCRHQVVVQIWSGVELGTDFKPSPVRVFFTEFVRVFGHALELTKKCVQFGPVDIVLSKFTMFPRENVLMLRSVLMLDEKVRAQLTSSKSANLS